MRKAFLVQNINIKNDHILDHTHKFHVDKCCNSVLRTNRKELKKEKKLKQFSAVLSRIPKIYSLSYPAFLIGLFFDKSIRYEFELYKDIRLKTRLF